MVLVTLVKLSLELLKYWYWLCSVKKIIVLQSVQYDLSIAIMVERVLRQALDFSYSFHKTNDTQHQQTKKTPVTTSATQTIECAEAQRSGAITYGISVLDESMMSGYTSQHGTIQ